MCVMTIVLVYTHCDDVSDSHLKPSTHRCHYDVTNAQLHSTCLALEFLNCVHSLSSLHSWNVLQSSCVDSVIHTSAQDPFNFVSISFTWARCDRQMRSNPWRLLNWVTMSGPKVKDTPLSFSPHPWTSLSGSDQRRSQRRPGRQEVSFTLERKMVCANQYCVFSRSAVLRECHNALDSVTKSKCPHINKLMDESHTISVSL